MADPQDIRAFPTLDDEEMNLLRGLAIRETLKDGQVLFRAGHADIDFFVVESGGLDIVNPTDDNAHIVTHHPGQFVGDIDLITRRPVNVTAIANGDTVILRVPGEKLRELLNTVPKLSDKLLMAFQVRRQLLQAAGVLGLVVLGHAHCSDTNVVREFLYKNFVPFVWYDTLTEPGQSIMTRLGSPKRTPVIECTDGSVLVNPSLRDVARCAGVWRECPDREFDFAIVGGGPAGMAAAVYAASEGLRTIVLDRLGPGGQASGSSKIENFIGFPAGLSGRDLATRASLQMMKFGAHMAAPIEVQRIEIASGEDKPHVLHLDCGNKISAYVVMIATGVAWRRLTVPGAERFERAGIYYACTSVEAAAHTGTEVAVVGAGNSAGQAAMYLAENCATRVHLMVRRDNLGESMSEYLTNRVQSTSNIVVHLSSEIAEVHGSPDGKNRIDRLTVKNKKTGDTQELNCSAVFVFIGAEPHANWLPPQIGRDELGYLLTGSAVIKSGLWPLKDREPCPLETSAPRILAGGDVRTGATKRVGFAVGDGSLAVTCVHRLKTLRV
jgi:thioredoxin reductase (NADPH)